MYCVCRDELNHASKEQALQFKSALVIRVGQHKERVLQDAEIVLLEELVGYLRIRRGEVVDDLQAHCHKVNRTRKCQEDSPRTVQASLGDVSHRMLDRPHDAIDE